MIAADVNGIVPVTYDVMTVDKVDVYVVAAGLHDVDEGVVTADLALVAVVVNCVEKWSVLKPCRHPLVLV